MRYILFAVAVVSLQAQTLPLKKQAWSIIGDSAFKLSNYSDGTLGFDFPAPPKNKNIQPASVSYLYTSISRSMAANSAVSATIQVSAVSAADFSYPSNACSTPANVRLYISSSGANLGAEFGYWWSNPISFQVGPGQVTLTVPLDPAAWSSVYGKFGNYDSSTLAMFQEALQTVQNIGLSFGGGCFFSNGVYATSGTPGFDVLNYTIW